MNVLTIVTHPRTDSLTFAVSEKFQQGLQDAGHSSDMLDLYRSGLDPVLRESDEPDWTADTQTFSPLVHKEQARLEKYDSLAFVFPLWWWSMPAMMKGYIDRVWNYGYAYGPGKLAHQHVLWLTLAGAPVERFEKRGYDEMINHYFNVGLADYCGIPSSEVSLLYQTVTGKLKIHEAEWLKTAYELGLNYGIKDS